MHPPEIRAEMFKVFNAENFKADTATTHASKSSAIGKVSFHKRNAPA
jgi:hypothetical protein